ncbi:MAG: hypothetical protein CVU29_08355 [Betaproteobacteria bacterium HGW-Betaproteobacteria-22]|nr:MAG: hypothetical protein CVU29_08355 [Betaproteobacteria bacterium HGW-Betaproteobacteria-22]
MLIALLTKKYPGMRLWLAQRISAVVMAVYVLIFIAAVAIMQPDGYDTWLRLMSPWWWRTLTLIFWVFVK